MLDGFVTRNHRMHACSNTFFNYDMYNCRNKKTYAKIVLNDNGNISLIHKIAGITSNQFW